MNSTLGKILKLRGFHFFATRFGPKSLRRLAFDEKFRHGDWDFANDGPKEMMQLVERNANAGHILLMGCGSAVILKDLPATAYASLLGIDLSSEAIRLATRYANDKVSFQQADMTQFAFPQQYDLILFSESLNYVPFLKRKKYLLNICQQLKPGGRIMVTISQSERYKSIFALIQKKFKIVEGGYFAGSRRRFVVFQPA